MADERTVHSQDANQKADSEMQAKPADAPGTAVDESDPQKLLQVNTAGDASKGLDS